jgi:hypothetical protein
MFGAAIPDILVPGDWNDKSTLARRRREPSPVHADAQTAHSLPKLPVKTHALKSRAYACHTLSMLSTIIAAAALILSVVTFWLTQRSARSSERRARMPVLVFVYDDGRWLLRNVGNGPALNVTTAIKYHHKGGDWEFRTRIPPIARDREFHLSWLGDLNVAILAASYEDFLYADTTRGSKEYTVRSEHDLNRVVSHRELPRWGVKDTIPAWRRQLDDKPRGDVE